MRGVVQDPAVDLDTELLPPGQPGVRTRLDTQARRVGVGPGDPETGGRAGRIRDRPSDERPVAYDATAGRDVVPRLLLVEHGETDEPVERRRDRVPRRGRSIEIRPEIVEA